MDPNQLTSQQTQLMIQKLPEQIEQVSGFLNRNLLRPVFGVIGNVLNAGAQIMDENTISGQPGQVGPALQLAGKAGESINQFADSGLEQLGIQPETRELLITSVDLALPSPPGISALKRGGKVVSETLQRGVRKGRTALKSVRSTPIPGSPTRVVDTGAARGAANTINNTFNEVIAEPMNNIRPTGDILEPQKYGKNTINHTYNEIGYDPKNRQIPIGGDEMKDIARRMELESQGHAIQPTFNEAGYQPKPPAVDLMGGIGQKRGGMNINPDPVYKGQELNPKPVRPQDKGPAQTPPKRHPYTAAEKAKMQADGTWELRKGTKFPKDGTPQQQADWYSFKLDNLNNTNPKAIAWAADLNILKLRHPEIKIREPNIRPPAQLNPSATVRQDGVARPAGVPEAQPNNPSQRLPGEPNRNANIRIQAGEGVSKSPQGYKNVSNVRKAAAGQEGTLKPDFNPANPQLQRNNLNVHHKRGAGRYQMWHENLTPAESNKLNKWFEDEGVPLANHPDNLVILPERGGSPAVVDNTLPIHKNELDSVHDATKRAGLQVEANHADYAAYQELAKKISQLTLNERMGILPLFIKYGEGVLDEMLQNKYVRSGYPSKVKKPKKPIRGKTEDDWKK